MDWQAEIDQCLLISIEKLLDFLSFDQPWTSKPQSGAISKHSIAIIEVLEKGFLLGRVQIFRGRGTGLKCFLYGLTIAAKRREEHARMRRRKAVPPENEQFVALDDVRQRELNDVNRLEVQPGDVVRWMNSTSEGRALLPVSLRAYLAAPAVTDAPLQPSVESVAATGTPAALSPSTGSTKGIARIQATRKACETVRAGIEQGEHGFYVNGEYKTNHDHFRRAVRAVLGGTEPHRDTVREEWEKAPEELKHAGRVPEQ
jgi:hypothetical protein